MRITKAEIEKVEITVGKPDPNCSRCGGTGTWNGLWCPCTLVFNKPVKKQVLIASERTKDGGIAIDLQEIKENEIH